MTPETDTESTDKKTKILLVEDNYMNQVLVTEILTLNGYDIVDAKTGTEAIKVFNEERPALVLMDLHLPGMDGVTATRIIKADSANKDIPILALTASGMEGEEDSILSKGFDGYVSKPIEVQKLLNAISEGLGKGASD
ncbi:MAG: response regulator [Proteobacteria bacterium]|nr:response regulator [Pseudomonadota bacterium]